MPTNALPRSLCPPVHNPAFNYPFRLHPTTHQFTQNKLTTLHFLTAITHNPTKSRHADSYLAILGRLLPEYAHICLQLIQLSLLCRITDSSSKHISRILTPKPKKNPTDPTTFRLISLCHDRNAFVNYIQQLLLTQTCEHTNVFPPSLYAYRPGHSCDDIINIRQAILEDAIENTTTPLLTGSDNKEKYFDRITIEHQCGTMLIVGCPNEGYIEMTAKDLNG